MQLISVNIGHEQSIQNGKKTGSSGIFKLPVLEPVEITPLGLKGDVIIDTKHHGGPDQAVYIYGTVDYAYWTETLGKPVQPGTFGENLTISDLESSQFSVGDRLIIGAITLEVTSPRIPCGTLAARMGDPQFVKLYRYAARPGLYCRVIQPGQVQVGADVLWQPYTGQKVSVLEMFHTFYESTLPEAELRRQLAAPIDIRARKDIEEQLQKRLE
jgi:MOSC domain-containing protein YiiM